MQFIKDMRNIKGHWPFMAFMLIVIAAEVGCARLTWYTVGERVSAFSLMFVALNLLPLLFYLLSLKRPAIGLAILGLLLSAPMQLLLGLHWHSLHQETLNFARYAEKVKIKDGSYPANLTGYTFLDPSLQEDFIYTRYYPDEYEVRFHIGSDTTEHVYANDGTWWYYPD